MCIFCGGQCGGVGEFLISLGLPLLALYFLRMKNALLKIIPRIFPRGSSAEKTQAKAADCRGGGERPSTTPPKIGLIGFKSQFNKSVQISNARIKFNNRQKLDSKEIPRGVKGWLLLLCLNLTIFIPASCLYEINCILDLFNYPQSKIYLLMFNNLLLYNLFLMGTMIFLSIFSFYAGMRLWMVKLKAVKTVKIFLVIQLVLTVILVMTRSFLTFPLAGYENNFAEIMKRLIPSLGNFILWYLYLGYSKRVYNTFSEAGKKPAHLRPLPTKLKGYTSAEGVWRSLS